MCDNTIFQSISEIGDIRRNFSSSSKCMDSDKRFVISVLSILEEYPSTQISVNDLLNLIYSRDNLFDYRTASTIYEPKDIVFYILACQRFFIPSCSDLVTVSIP